MTVKVFDVFPRSCSLSWSREYLSSSDTAHLRAHRSPRFLSATLLRGAEVGLFGLVFAFFSIRSFHAVRSAPVSTSSLAAARRICVCPIFPQPPEIGKK